MDRKYVAERVGVSVALISLSCVDGGSPPTLGGPEAPLESAGTAGYWGAQVDPTAPGAGGAGIPGATSSGGLVSGGAETGGNSGDPPLELDLVAHLMASRTGAASEAAPSGVPSDWSWVSGATETETTPPSSSYTHANYWGAIFRGVTNASPENTLVEIRNCTMAFLLEGDSVWTLADSSVELGGATFTPTYGGGGPKPVVLQQQSTGVDVVPAIDHIYHFWQANGYQPVPEPIQEIITNCQARLALRRADGADDRSEADYLIHMGADFRDPGDPNCSNDGYICPSFGVSRFERVQIEFRNHTFHSLTEDDIENGTPLPPAELFDLEAN